MRDDPIIVTDSASFAGWGAAVVGLILLFYGVTGLLFAGDSLATDVPRGTVDGETWLGIEGNGWTNILALGAGLLLILASPADGLARLTALLVALGLGAASVVAIVDGDDVLGVAAADGATALALGATALVLLAVALVQPRWEVEDPGAEPFDGRSDRSFPGEDAEHGRARSGTAHRPTHVGPRLRASRGRGAGHSA